MGLLAAGSLGSLWAWLDWAANAPVATAASAVRYLAPTGQDDGNDCRQPTTPCATLQHTLDQADSGDEVWLAEGVYTAVAAQQGYTQTGYIQQPITLRGGYPANFATPPDPILHPTTLSPLGLGRGLTISGTEGVVVENLRIEDGYAPHGNGRGGGIYLHHASLTLSNTVLFSNTAEYGGGLYAQNSHLEWLGGSAHDNYAGYGGAAYLQSTTGYAHYVEWIENTADIGGGALRLYDSQLELADNLLAENRASVHGGGVYAGRSNLLLRHNSWYNNLTTSPTQSWGGALSLSQCAGGAVVANTFTANSARIGGGLRLFDCDMVLEGNVVQSNQAASGGGLALEGGSEVTLDNNVVRDNLATAEGAGALVRDSASTWRHTTWANNRGGDGTAVTVLGQSEAILLNSLIAAQAVGVRLQGSQATAEVTAVLWADVDTPIDGSVVVSGAIVGLAGLAADGYHLLPSSDAPNGGFDAGVSEDIDGQPRPQAGGFDLGADELATLLNSKLASHRFAAAGQTITYTIWLTNTTPLAMNVLVTDVLPSAVEYLGPLQASAGVAEFIDGEVRWAGEVAGDTAVSIVWPVQLPITLSQGTTISNTAVIWADEVLFTPPPALVSIPFPIFLPFIGR